MKSLNRSCSLDVLYVIYVLGLECSYWVTVYPAGQDNRSSLILLKINHSTMSIKHFGLN